MSKAKTKPEKRNGKDAHRGAMARWARTALRAQNDHANALWNGGASGPVGEAERTAIDAVASLATMFVEGREPDTGEVEALRRVAAALWPGNRDTRIATGVRMVERAAAALSACRNANEKRKACIVLADWLCIGVHAGFGALREKPDKTGELLGSYEGTSGRRTKDGKGGGKLSAAGVFAELNTLAGYPLERLDAHTIANAVGRARDRERIPGAGT